MSKSTTSTEDGREPKRRISRVSMEMPNLRVNTKSSGKMRLDTIDVKSVEHSDTEGAEQSTDKDDDRQPLTGYLKKAESCWMLIIFVLGVCLFVAADSAIAATIEIKSGGQIKNLITNNDSLCVASQLNSTITEIDMQEICSFLWDKGLHIFVIWIVLWSVLLPFTTLVLQLVACFRPLRITSRSNFLALTTFIAKFALSEVFMFSVIVAGLTVRFDSHVPVRRPVEQPIVTESYQRIKVLSSDCIDDPTGALSQKGFNCEMLSAMCDTDLSTVDPTTPKGTTGWMMCPVTCDRCDDFTIAVTSGDLVFIGIQPPTSQDSCIDDETGSVSKSGMTCLQVLPLCSTDLSTLQQGIPVGALGWMFCPVTCSSCDVFLKAKSDGELIFIGVGVMHTECPDDPTNAISNAGLVCSDIIMMCETDLSTVRQGIPMGAKGWMFCPSSCSKCDDYIKAAASGELLFIGVQVDNTMKDPPCLDDAIGSVAQSGSSCSSLTAMCLKDMNTVQPNIPRGAYGWMFCPVTCNKCSDYVTAYGSGELQFIGLVPNSMHQDTPVPTPSPSRCKDDASGLAELSGISCADVGLSACTIDLSIISSLIPSGVFGWMLCPLSCNSCIEYREAYDSGNVPFSEKPDFSDIGCSDNHFVDCSSLLSGNTTTCQGSLPGTGVVSKWTFGWMLCPKVCRKCDEFVALYLTGGLQHLFGQDTVDCIDDLGGLLDPQVGNCDTLTQECTEVIPSESLRGINESNEILKWQICPKTCSENCNSWRASLAAGEFKAHLGLWQPPACRDGFFDEVRGLSDTCSNLNTSYCNELPEGPEFGNLPPNTTGWALCPQKCNNCSEWYKSFSRGEFSYLQPQDQVPDSESVNVMMEFSVVPGAACYLFVLGTIVIVWWGMFMNHRWRYLTSLGLNKTYFKRRPSELQKAFTPHSCLSPRSQRGSPSSSRRKSPFARVKISPKPSIYNEKVVLVPPLKQPIPPEKRTLGFAAACFSVIGFVFSIIGNVHATLACDYAGLLPEMSDVSVGVEFSMLKLASDSLEKGGGNSFFGIVILIFGIIIPLCLPIICIVVLITQTTKAAVFLNRFHPFAMADVLVLSSLVVSSDIEGLVKHTVESILQKCLLSSLVVSDSISFIKLEAVPKSGIFLLLTGTIFVHLGAAVTLQIINPFPDGVPVSVSLSTKLKTSIYEIQGSEQS